MSLHLDAELVGAVGAEDIDATYCDEKVVHVIGSTTADRGSELFLRRLVENAGFEPQFEEDGYVLF